MATVTTAVSRMGSEVRDRRRAEAADRPHAAEGQAGRDQPDHAAFIALVRLHDQGLRRLAYRLLGDADLMDDVLQEAYLKAFRGLPRFRGDSSAKTWKETWAR